MVTEIQTPVKIGWLILVVAMVLMLSTLSYAQMELYENHKDEVDVFHILRIERGNTIWINEVPLYLPLLSPVWS